MKNMFDGTDKIRPGQLRWVVIVSHSNSRYGASRSLLELAHDLGASDRVEVAGHCGAGTGELGGDTRAGLLYDGSVDHLAEVIAALIEDPADGDHAVRNVPSAVARRRFDSSN